jgi:hypothetical protein
MVIPSLSMHMHQSVYESTSQRPHARNVDSVGFSMEKKGKSVSSLSHWHEHMSSSSHHDTASFRRDLGLASPPDILVEFKIKVHMYRLHLQL